jgi:hypothetical protein
MENLDNLMAQVKIDGTLNAKDFVNSLLFSNADDSKLKNLRSEFKTKFLDPFTKELKKIKPNDIKNMFDPLGISDISDELKNNFDEYQKQLKNFLKRGFPKEEGETNKNEKLKNTYVDDVIPSKIKDAEINNDTSSEQKSFGPEETLIDLSDKSKTFFVDLFDKMGENTFKNNDKTEKMFSKYFNEFLEKQDEMIASNSESGFLGTLGKVLAIGGIATVLVAAFWDSHIKPWLEDKFDINLDFLDKFEGLVEGLGKFFTMGGLKITFGPLLKIVGSTLTSFGELVEKGLGFVFKTLLGGAGDELVQGGAQVASKAGFFKGMLPKIAGGLFKGLGATFLKGIPVIGSLISFYFAYDRFQKGDYIGSVIDVVGGLANLLSFTPLAPLALPISLGAAALNAFLDYKAGGLPEGQQQGAKLGFLGDLASSIYGVLKDVPIIGGLIKFGLGIYELASGNFSKALDYLVEQPFLGPIPGIIKSFMDATVKNPDGTSSFSLDKFTDELKRNMFKFIISIVPNMFGMRGMIAKVMGLDYNDTTGDIKVSEDPYNLDSINQKEKSRNEKISEMAELPKGTEYDPKTEQDILKAYEKEKENNKRLKEDYNKTQEGSLDGWNPFHDEDAEIKAKENFEQAQDTLLGIMKKLESYRKLKDPTEKYNAENAIPKFDPEQKPPIQVQDFTLEPKGISSLIMDRSNNQMYQTSPNDEIIASKKGGILDKSLQDIKNIMMEVNKNILNFNNSNSNPVVVNNNSTNVMGGGGNQGKEYLFKPMYDVNTDKRIAWWKASREYSATA